MRMKKRSIPIRQPGKRTPEVSGTAVLNRVHLKATSQRRPSGIIPLLECHGSSEVGRRREENEDDFLMTALPMGQDLRFDQDPTGKRLVLSPGQTGFLFLVADGVGGVPCGERASSMAVKSLSRFLKDRSRVLEKGRLEIIRTLRRGIRHCHSDLQLEVERHPECDGMSTTLTGVLALEKWLYVVHSGDSRCYLLRGSTLNLVTHDHTEAQLNNDAGTGDTARTSPGGNHLWNFLTSDHSELRPDVNSMPLDPGDILLLCTDGVSDALPAEEIKTHLSSRTSAEGICKGLIAAARERGGGDDLTVVVARFGCHA
jgi:serine/threonine protein phosphatase PrpC